MKLITANIIVLIGLALIVISGLLYLFHADRDLSTGLFGMGVAVVVLPGVVGVKRTGRHSK